MKIAGTGHRPDKLCGYRVPNAMSDCVGNLLRQYLLRERPEEVITGMALGFDQWLAWMCIELNIPFAAYIPCDNFDSRWPDYSREQFRHLMQRAARVVQVSPGEPYHASLMQRRNARMVDDTDKVVSLWNGSPGGTANCIRYAMAVGKPIDQLPVPVEVWDQAREWEQRNVRRNRPPTEPVWGRPVHLQRRRRSNIVDQLIQEQRANENRDIFAPEFEVRITPVEPVSRPFRPEARIAPAPAPRLTDEFPVAVPASTSPADVADALRQHINEDVMRELVRQNRHLLLREQPQTKIKSTDNLDRFTPRRKIDLDE